MKVIRTMSVATYSISDLTEEEYEIIRSALYILKGERFKGLYDRPDLKARLVLERLPTIESFRTPEGKTSSQSEGK